MKTTKGIAFGWSTSATYTQVKGPWVAATENMQTKMPRKM